MQTEITQGLYQRLQKLTAEATPEQLVYLTKALELIRDKEDEEKAAAHAINEIEAITKRSIAGINDLKTDVINSLKEIVKEQTSSFNTTIENMKHTAHVTNNISDTVMIPEAIPYLMVVRGFDKNYSGNLSRAFAYRDILNFDRSMDTGISYYDEPSIKYMRCKPFYLNYNKTEVAGISHHFAFMIFLKNTTRSDITTQIKLNTYGDESKSPHKSLWIGVPNATNSERDKINSLKWSDIAKLEATEKSHHDKYEITCPADKTVIFMVHVYSSYGNEINFEMNDDRKDEFFVGGLEIDKERTVKALQLPRIGAPSTWTIWK